MDTINMKSNFYNELHKNRKNLANNTSFLSDEKYDELTEIISELKAGRKKKEPKDFRLIKRYDVLVVQGKTKLIFPVKDDNVVLYYVPTSELFDILQATHVSIGHGGRVKIKSAFALKIIFCALQNVIFLQHVVISRY
uniref:KRAB-A domain-containing protein 2 n=1 Tax=Schizaphis graminum TaxID=13262 RepID=A0A2S2P516_SCHGA